jgi:hypothetical protein
VPEAGGSSPQCQCTISRCERESLAKLAIRRIENWTLRAMQTASISAPNHLPLGWAVRTRADNKIFPSDTAFSNPSPRAVRVAWVQTRQERAGERKQGAETRVRNLVDFSATTS